MQQEDYSESQVNANVVNTDLILDTEGSQDAKASRTGIYTATLSTIIEPVL